MLTSREIHSAYIDCRRRKRGTINALRFEMNLAENLINLEEELNASAYKPTRSVCFVNLKPKPREIFAADFRDRVVHHLFIREIETYWEKVFIHDSFACRPGKGTHAAVDRLERFVKSISRGGRQHAWFLQIDIRNFFMSIDKRILWRLVDRGLRKQFDIPHRRLPLFCKSYRRYTTLAQLAKFLIEHDSTEYYSRKSCVTKWSAIAPEKSLFACKQGKGLPIGNLTSQFFANIYMNEFDQFVQHDLKVHHYIRYVDDAVLLHEDKAVLERWLFQIENFLSEKLGLELNPKATKLRPLSNGINFLGYIVHPTHRLVRRRVVGNFEARLGEYRDLLVVQDAETSNTAFHFAPETLERLLAVLNSYLAHFGKASSHNLMAEILGEHPWLSRYFKIENHKAERKWKPPRDFTYLATQYKWFRRNWLDDVILFQIGKYTELFGRDARFVCETFGFSHLKPRFGRMQRAGIPLGMSDTLTQRIVESGRNILLVRETGYPLYKLKERLPFQRFESM